MHWCPLICWVWKNLNEWKAYIAPCATDRKSMQAAFSHIMARKRKGECYTNLKGASGLKNEFWDICQRSKSEICRQMAGSLAWRSRCVLRDGRSSENLSRKIPLLPTAWSYTSRHRKHFIYRSLPWNDVLDMAARKNRAALYEQMNGNPVGVLK